MQRLHKPPNVNPAFAEAVPLALIVQSILGGFANIVSAITNTVNNQYIAQLPIINDHSQHLADIQDVVERLILQGDALVLLDDELYYPPDGLIALDVILIAAGGGGGAGKWDITANRWGGGGGAGGGEVHHRIMASLLPKGSDDHFLPIQFLIGTGGVGGINSEQPGNGGGNTRLATWLTAGGGQGGRAGTSALVTPATGGTGMIPGGNGGGMSGGDQVQPGTSVSPVELYGGGGGGGMGGNGSGGGQVFAQAGGQGGISPGGQPGQPGQAPSPVVPTGGGGGGGALTDQAPGGAGAYPGGGGGGGYGGATTHSGGGNGGNGIAFLMERFT